MRQIKFRELLPNKNFHYWGFLRDGAFIGPSDPKGIHMQLTGLKDKNGNEIYESDIVRILYTDWPSNSDQSISLEDYKKSISQRGEVFWNDPFAEFALRIWSPKYNDFATSTILHGKHGEIEVIGNIHEHAELLK